MPLEINKEILSPKQEKLLSLLPLFSDNFGMIGGTALALQLGHRKSIDFDLASTEKFSNQGIKNDLYEAGYTVDQALVDREGELTIIVQGVKVTFLFYPYPITFKVPFEGWIDLGSIIDIAALKSYALGRRAKWKDYVDLYFVMNKGYLLEDIDKRAKEIFGREYNEKLFRSQLAYFEDIDYSEKVDFMEGFSKSNKEIQGYLIRASLS